jgi:hypothetical protein
MEKQLVDLVWRRAGHRCEYCQLSQTFSVLTFEVDHIIARKHDGLTVDSNLALSCYYCNSFKGSNIAGFDPRTKRLSALYHPRRNSWQRHFRWDGPLLIGRTPVGRTTIKVLLINLELRLVHRQWLMEAGLFPPTSI